MPYKTPLYDFHLASGAKMVDFHGWQMPLHYGSQLDEHHAVRTDVGMFDVSHMGILDITGKSAKPFLQMLLAGDVARLKQPGQALYTCMLNDQGGILDDLIVYQFTEAHYRLIVNAGTQKKDTDWLKKHALSFEQVSVQPQDLCIIAIQGPSAIQKIATIFASQAITCLKSFTFLEKAHALIAKTGYTGETGVEVMLPAAQAKVLWQDLLDKQVRPCGLAARDTLRLEAGLNLYGSDMDETTTPLESHMGPTVTWEPTTRDFIGRLALVRANMHPQRKLVGLLLNQKGMLRQGQTVIVPGLGEGQVTSGSFSPTLGRTIALARVPHPAHPNTPCFVMMRQGKVPAQIVKPPFVRHGKVVYA